MYVCYYTHKNIIYDTKVSKFNIISVVLRLWNTLPNQIKGTKLTILHDKLLGKLAHYGIDKNCHSGC